MLDNQLFALIISVIDAQKSVAGLPDLPVQQAFQPQQQGVPTAASAFLHKLFDHRLGFPYRGDAYDPVSREIVHTELQDYETTFQISALSTQDPADINQMTASDICNLLAHIMQSDAAIEKLGTAGVGILRVTEVRNTYFTDDHGRNAASPSFDFTLQHKQIIVSTADAVTATKFRILPL